MKNNILVKLMCYTLFVVLYCTSCQREITPPADIQPTSTPYFLDSRDAEAEVLNEILRITGENNNSDAILKVESNQAVRFNWEQFCKTDFYLALIPLNVIESDPELSEISVTLSDSPSYGSVDFELPAGEYRVIIESDGSWEIWAESINLPQE